MSRGEISPGPWTIRPDGLFPPVLVDADGRTVAHVFRSQADATLAAAAPELAGVLLALLAEVDTDNRTAEQARQLLGRVLDVGVAS